MGPDAANLVSSIQKSLEVDRSPNASQRASDISQEQLAGEAASALARKKTDAAIQISREKIRREHERRRQELERRGMPRREIPPDDGDGSGLDVVV